MGLEQLFYSEPGSIDFPKGETYLARRVLWIPRPISLVSWLLDCCLWRGRASVFTDEFARLPISLSFSNS